MAHHEVVENNVKKELSMALVGIVLFLVMVAFIAVMAFLRPAGEHHSAESLNTQASASSVASTATATNDASTVASTATGTTATATDAKPAVVNEAKAQVASASAEIEAKTGENVDVKAPIASATN